MKLERDLYFFMKYLDNNIDFFIKESNDETGRKALLLNTIDAIPSIEVPHDYELDHDNLSGLYGIISTIFIRDFDLIKDVDVLEKVFSKIPFVEHSSGFAQNLLKYLTVDSNHSSLLSVNDGDAFNCIEAIDVLAQRMVDAHGEASLCSALSSNKTNERVLFHLKNKYFKGAIADEIVERNLLSWMINPKESSSLIKLFSSKVAHYLSEDKGIKKDINWTQESRVLFYNIMIAGLLDDSKNERLNERESMRFYQNVPSDVFNAELFFQNNENLINLNQVAFIDFMLYHYALDNYALHTADEDDDDVQRYQLFTSQIQGGHLAEPKEEKFWYDHVKKKVESTMMSFSSQTLSKTAYQYLLSGLDGVQSKAGAYLSSILSCVNEPDGSNVINDVSDGQFDGLINSIKVFNFTERLVVYNAIMGYKEDAQTIRQNEPISSMVFESTMKLVEKASHANSKRGQMILDKVSELFVSEFNARMNDSRWVRLNSSDILQMVKMLDKLVSHKAFSQKKVVLFDKINAPLTLLLGVQDINRMPDAFYQLAFTEKRLSETLNEKVDSSKMIKRILDNPKNLHTLIELYEKDLVGAKEVLRNKVLSKQIKLALKKIEESEAGLIQSKIDKLLLESMIQEDSPAVHCKPKKLKI